MRNDGTHETVAQEERAGRLDAYQMRADPAVAVISAFYLVLLLIPRVAISSHASSIVIAVLDVVFWVVLTVDTAFRCRLALDRRERYLRLITLAFLLCGPLLFLKVDHTTRDLVRIALIVIVGLRAIDSVRYFFRQRSILYIISAVILIDLAFGVMMAITEEKEPGANITSLSDGFWWAITTVSTVGYGDKYPVSNAGRVIATGLMFFGVAMFSILTATLATAFLNRSESGVTDRLQRIDERLTRIEADLSENSQPVRRTRAPRRPRRRTQPPRIGGAVSTTEE